MRKWEDLPIEMQNEEVRYYYNILCKKTFSLILKRGFDIVVSSILLLCLSWLFILLAIIIKIDSSGPIFYRQERITQYGNTFKIHKFRTMVTNADKRGSLVTLKDDSRITRVGKKIRKYRLDEISQLIDVFNGSMTLVGTRPEVEKFVKEYSPEMLATLLLPAGITSEASVTYRDEEKLLDESKDINNFYLEKILPKKMIINLNNLENFNLYKELKILIKTVMVVLYR
ncbi:sugar transferase [Enterococcus faecium]|uniref:sugar transferase n=1 Tax=Enterococcus TaxID=1350 RepID=UPI001C501A78|nr:sugar transferase [Enterococcus faecium]UQR32722.1 sugar transferase [Enterococcus faecium]